MKKATSFWKFVIILLLPLLLIVLLVVVIDPFFHYHKPLSGLSYMLSDERYQNDGIVKHFDYEALITGSSVTQNFKASDVETIWGLETIKVSYAGGQFKEVDSLVKTAAAANPDLKLVIRDLGLNMINLDKDSAGYTDYPDYLYDSNPFNDHEYVLNKDVLLDCFRSLYMTVKGIPSTTFDEYSNWTFGKTFGKDAVKRTIQRVDPTDYPDASVLSDEDYLRIKENLESNIISTALEYPDIEFYLFFPPYSTYFWDSLIRTNSYDMVLEEIRYAAGLLTEIPNIHLYGFDNEIEITGNPDNYMDSLHYAEWVNTCMLEAMADGSHMITTENIEEYITEIRSVHENYDFDALY